MDEDPRRTVAELAKGMEAAGALIESLEEEAANRRRDLERATATLRTAEVEVASSAGMLEEGERARARAQRELDALRAENSDLKRRRSEVQVPSGPPRKYADVQDKRVHKEGDRRKFDPF